mmetsp:Transcript_14344/g.17109  ORF Transcript_14344/g.17109 Transcript_14344/m.17109 type:complete len:100 (-) Transcript_14344:71-370(-)
MATTLRQSLHMIGPQTVVSLYRWPSFLGPDYIADIVQADLLPDFSGRFAQSPLPMVALLAVVTFSLGMVLWRCQRHGSPGMTVLGGASLEEGIAPPLLE